MIEEMTKEMEKLKRSNEGLKESKQRMQLFINTRNRQIGELNEQIEKYKDNEVQLQ